MLRARDGDRRAFEVLYDRWSGRLFRWLHRKCRQQHLAEDLVHETFLRLWKARQRYEVRAKFATYLFQIAGNLWINQGTKTVRRGLHLSLDASAATGEDGEPLSARVAGTDPGPAAEAIRRETGGRISAAVEQLTEKQREVFLLGAVEGLPYADVSALLDIPEGTVKSRMWSAVQRLRAILEEPA